MAKGKYAAKAVNKAAAVDNEVIAELRDRVAKLEESNRQLNHQLDIVERPQKAEILERAEELAAARLDLLSQQHESEVAALKSRLMAAAEELVHWWRSGAQFDNVASFTEVLMPLLVADSIVREKMVDSAFDESSGVNGIGWRRAGNRYTRRNGGRNISRASRQNAAADGGDRLLSRLPDSSIAIAAFDRIAERATPVSVRKLNKQEQAEDGKK